MLKSSSNQLISVGLVVPVYSGETYLRDLVEQIDALREQWKNQSAPMRLVEAIFVNDDAIDGSLLVLEKLSKKYQWLKVLTLSKNFGQHAATVAGICHTLSDWIVTLDEDLQHKPEQITRLFEVQSERRCDVVYAAPLSGSHGGSWRDSSSVLVKRTVAYLTSTPQIRAFNSFRLIRGSLGRAAASSSTSGTYLDIALSWFTKSYAQAELSLEDLRFTDDSRSGYGFLKLANHARKLLVNSELDVSIGGLVVGGFSIFLAAVLAGLSVVQKLFFPESVGLVGWTSLMATLTFFSGVVIALLCVLLEYLNVITSSSLGKPVFFTVDRTRDEILRDWFKGF